jgi:hypothetical protein
MLRFAMGIEQWSPLNRPCGFLAAKIRIICAFAAACAEGGRFAEAKETARQAFPAPERRSNSTLANALQDEIALYELGLPYHK